MSIRTQTRRRRTTSDTSRPAIIVSANTSTQTWAGSWETCTLMNGTAPSNRTMVPSSSRVCSPARRLTRAFLVSRFCSMSRGSSENSDCGRPVSSPVSPLVDVDGHGRVVQRREARRQQRAVELLGRREQALDGDLVLAALVGVGIGAAGRVEPHHARRQQGDRVVGPPLQVCVRVCPSGKVTVKVGA